MVRLLLLTLGLALAANGLFMLCDASSWYVAVPGVIETGPFNKHFVLDIGCAYLVAGASTMIFAIDRCARFAALARAIFLALHGLIHLSAALNGTDHHLTAELVTIYAPAFVLLGLTIPKLPDWPVFPIPKSLILRRIRDFERANDYDMSYARYMLDADPSAFLKFANVAKLASHNSGAPRDAWYASKLVSALAEDCGPCTQLVTGQAEEAGVQPGVLRAVLSGDEASLTADVALAVRFTRAVLSHDPAAGHFRTEIVNRWGTKGLVSISLAIMSARLFPTIKYALGFGQSCQHVIIGGAKAPVSRRPA